MPKNPKLFSRKLDIMRVEIKEVNPNLAVPLAKGVEQQTFGMLDIDISNAPTLPKVGDFWWVDRRTGRWRLKTPAGTIEESIAVNQHTAADVGAVSTSDGGEESITELGQSTPSKTLFAAGSGNVCTVTMNDDCVFNLASDLGEGAKTFTLIITGSSGYTATFTDVLWDSGTPPVISDNIDILRFMTIDGGTTWYGFIEAQDMA